MELKLTRLYAVTLIFGIMTTNLVASSLYASVYQDVQTYLEEEQPHSQINPSDLETIIAPSNSLQPEAKESKIRTLLEDMIFDETIPINVRFEALHHLGHYEWEIAYKRAGGKPDSDSILIKTLTHHTRILKILILNKSTPLDLRLSAFDHLNLYDPDTQIFASMFLAETDPQILLRIFHILGWSSEKRWPHDNHIISQLIGIANAHSENYIRGAAADLLSPDFIGDRPIPVEIENHLHRDK